MKRFRCGLLVVVGLLLICLSSMASINTDRLVQMFKQTSSESKKVQALQGLVKEGNKDSYCAFYRLLMITPVDKLEPFETVIKSTNGYMMIAHADYYLTEVVKPFQNQIKQLDQSGKSQDEIMEIIGPKVAPQFDSLNLRLASMQEAIATAARPHKAELVKRLRTLYAGKNTSDASIECLGLTLVTLQEEGYEALLQDLRTENDKNTLIFITPKFGPYAVVPALKAIENPKSTALQSEAARTAIFALPIIEPVVDKLVEAYRHGPYFPQEKRTVTDLTEIFSSMDKSWCWRVVSRLKDGPQFVNHIATMFLFEPKGQDQIIYLLKEIDLRKAMICFYLLDPNKLSESSLISISLCFHVSVFEREKMAPYEFDRYLFMCHLFEKSTPETRKTLGLIFSLKSITPLHQEAFTIAYFSKMTDEEQGTAIYMAKNLEPTVRDRIYDKIKPLCSKENADMIEYYREGKGLPSLDY